MQHAVTLVLLPLLATAACVSDDDAESSLVGEERPATVDTGADAVSATTVVASVGTITRALPARCVGGDAEFIDYNLRNRCSTSVSFDDKYVWTSGGTVPLGGGTLIANDFLRGAHLAKDGDVASYAVTSQRAECLLVDTINFCKPPSTRCGVLLAGEGLSASIPVTGWLKDSIASCNGAYRLFIQNDGKLVLYATASGKPVWVAPQPLQTGAPEAMVVLQGDGNFVVYSRYHQATFATGTQINPLVQTALLRVQDDGNVVLYANGTTPLWSSRYGKLQ